MTLTISVNQMVQLFEFNSKDFETFIKSQDVNLTFFKNKSEMWAACQCTASCDSAGILKSIILPNITDTYKIDVIGYANNDITYIHVADANGNNLYNKYCFLSKSNSTNSTSSSISFEFVSATRKINIGVLMGAGHITTTSNYFRLSNIKITSNSLSSSPPSSSPVNKNVKPKNNHNYANLQAIRNDIRITRTFETVDQMNQELSNLTTTNSPPNRNNQTPMEIGEYAILKNQDKPDDLYVLNKHNDLQYVCRIFNGLPSFFGTSLHNHPGKIMPVYPDHQTAMEDLNKDPINFYKPKADYVWPPAQDLYLYLDNKGYVRWLKHDLSSTNINNLQQ